MVSVETAGVVIAPEAVGNGMPLTTLTTLIRTPPITKLAVCVAEGYIAHSLCRLGPGQLLCCWSRTH